MAMNPNFLDMLRCPENKTTVSLADEWMVEQINRGIADRRINNRVGQPVQDPIEGGLVREDGQYLYPIVHGIPIMLVDDAIPLDQIDRERE
jgi:uncharacterized protein YbaR (Trm112 family)